MYVLQSFYLCRDQSQIRIKSEAGIVKHVEALQVFFFLSQISSIVFLKVKNLAFTPYCVCVCGGGGGGGQDVITIQTSTMTPPSATVSRVPTARVVGGLGMVTNAFYSHNACWCMRALNNNGNVHRR